MASFCLTYQASKGSKPALATEKKNNPVITLFNKVVMLQLEILIYDEHATYVQTA